jgi:hypothetical protein
MKKPRRPTELTGHAKRFWESHIECVKDEHDIDSFILLCQVFDRCQVLAQVPPTAENYREAGQYNAMLKQFEKYAKAFGLLGEESRKAGEEDTTPPWLRS